MATDSTGVPIQLLHEGEGHVITVELKNGEIYKGMLSDAEDTMNCQMKEVTMTSKNGRVVRLENVFLRGAQIKFIVLPDLLKNAPILKKIQGMKTKSSGQENAKGLGVNAKKQRKS